jgi:hypothetical protein
MPFGVQGLEPGVTAVQGPLRALEVTQDVGYLHTDELWSIQRPTRHNFLSPSPLGTGVDQRRHQQRCIDDRTQRRSALRLCNICPDDTCVADARLRLRTCSSQVLTDGRAAMRIATVACEMQSLSCGRAFRP